MNLKQVNLPHKQRGTVLITVVLIAAFIIVLVVESTKTVRYQQQLSSNLIHRDQAYSYLMGMEELAKIWLKKAFENEKDEVVHLNQPWAQEDITFPIDGGIMTASIKDMQSCFNLNSIGIMGSGKKDDKGNQLDGAAAKTAGQQIFEELISQVNEDTSVTSSALATAVRDWIDTDIEPSGPDGAEDGYYQGLEVAYRTANTKIAHVSELRVIKDFNDGLLTLLAPYICVIPGEEVEQININTVTEENAVVLYAVLNDNKVSLSDVKQALSKRGENGFKEVAEFVSELAEDAKSISTDQLAVNSYYFEISAQAEVGRTKVAMKTLFKRDDENNFNVVSRYFGKE